MLHITADFPDYYAGNKTPAVRELIDRTSGVENLVYSLNRRSAVFWERHATEKVISVCYLGFAFGIGLPKSLDLVARKILADAAVASFRPTLIHAHKLSFEGYVAERVARRLGIPCVVTIRGNTDVKVLKYKPAYRAAVRNVVEQAAWVFYGTPWARDGVKQYIKVDFFHKSELLPNFVDSVAHNQAGEEPMGAGERFVTVFHLRNARLKNLKRLALALQVLRSRGMAVGLDVVGGGTAEEIKNAQQLVRKAGGNPDIRFLGAIENHALRARMHEWKALVLPSYPETFGLVYLEALHAGIPIMHAKQAGVDGLFDQSGVSVAVDHRSVDEIANGLQYLVEKENELRRNVRTLQSSGALKEFSSQVVVNRYCTRLDEIRKCRTSD